jgi:hypothetical protein
LQCGVEGHGLPEPPRCRSIVDTGNSTGQGGAVELQGSPGRPHLAVV